MMKILHNSLFLILLCSFTFDVSAQSTDLTPIHPENISSFVNEVYKQGQTSFENSNPTRYRQLEDLLKNRVFFMESTTPLVKAININTISLFDKYNNSLEVDTQFNPDSFNPLKYDLPFWTVSNYVYRLGNSSYYLVIKGQTFKN